MTKIRAVIVDDEELSRHAVRLLLQRDGEVEIVGEAADGTEAIQLVHQSRPDLMFLDMQMPMADGLTVARELGPGERPHIVFVTAFAQYAVEAFAAQAVDYLVKPFERARFAQTLARVKAVIRNGTLRQTEETLAKVWQTLSQLQGGTGTGSPGPNQRLVVKADGQLHFLETGEIRWIEAQGNFVRIHLTTGRLLARLAMDKALEQLDTRVFLRIHKSSIVNLTHVRRLKPVLSRSLGVELDDGTVVPVGRSYRPKLERHIGSSSFLSAP